ncbi:MAG: MASE1 domain-containing protein [Chloroflexota bacterium]
MKSTDQTGETALKSKQNQVMRIILIALVYLISFNLLDFLTKQFEVSPGIVTWYPPAGLTYALLLVFGARFTPAVILTLILSSVFVYRMPQPSFLLFLWSLVISLIYAATAWFLRHRIHLDLQLRKLRDVVWLILTTMLGSAFLAVLSVSSSALSSAMPRSEILLSVFHWWIGETVGVLTITPFLLLYVMPWLKRFVDGQSVRMPKHFSFPSPALTFIGKALSIVLILYWVFGTRILDEFRPMYLMILPLIWIAIEHGFKRLTVAILAMNFGVVFSTWYFGFDLARLGELELLMITICVVGLLVGAVVAERKQAEHQKQDRVKELRTLYSLSKMIERENITLDEVYQDYTNILPEGWQYPEITCARITVLGSEFRTNNFKESAWMQSAPIKVDASIVGRVEVGYLEERMEEGEGPFLVEERQLIDEIAERLGKFIQRKQSDQSSLENEEKYRSLVNEVNDGFYISDVAGVFTFANSSLARMYGVENPQALIGRMFSDFIAPDMPAGLNAAYSKAMQIGHSPEVIEGQILRPDKSRIFIEIKPVMIVQEDQIVGSRGVVRDITERKQAEEALHLKIDELELFQNLTVGRELKMIELKKEINSLLKQAGKPEKYPRLDEG